MQSPRTLALIIGTLALAGCAPAVPGGNGTGSGSGVACTMEAKLCPDGSYVGRQGPNCEFAPCPGEASSDASSESVSDGTISFDRPDDFALAVSADQMPHDSSIPPCEQGFTYCLHYVGGAYEGTNFETAGLGIVKWTGTATEDACLDRSPDGYDGIAPVGVRHEDGYATSVFAPLGDAAAGHYAHDRLYRLSVGTSCYEFKTRVGSSQFANYPEGSIDEFTDSDEAAVQAKLQAVLGGVRFETGGAIAFPEVPDSSR